MVPVQWTVDRVVEDFEHDVGSRHHKRSWHLVPVNA